MKAIKEQLIEQFLNEPIKVGDRVIIRGRGLQNKSAWGSSANVLEVLEDDTIRVDGQHGGTEVVVKENYKKYTSDIGENPIRKDRNKVRMINFSLESILHSLGVSNHKTKYTLTSATTGEVITISDCNTNPYVYLEDGTKRYYQRDFVWTVTECQSLLNSIYNNCDCGKILVRNYSYKELQDKFNNGETELFWYDVIDGKQRLTAIIKFINNEYPDSFGNYFKDFSDIAQHMFLNHQLFSYGEMEGVTDEEVLEQFLKINVAGVPQSENHIKTVDLYLSEIRHGKAW